MNIRTTPATDEELKTIGEGAQRIVMKAPEGVANCGDAQSVRVMNDAGQTLTGCAWIPDATDIAFIAMGTPIWIWFVGGMPPHLMSVGTEPM